MDALFLSTTFPSRSMGWVGFIYDLLRPKSCCWVKSLFSTGVNVFQDLRCEETCSLSFRWGVSRWERHCSAHRPAWVCVQLQPPSDVSVLHRLALISSRTRTLPRLITCRFELPSQFWNWIQTHNVTSLFLSNLHFTHMSHWPLNAITLVKLI